MRVKPRSPKAEVASRYAGFRRRLAAAHQRDATAVRPWSFTDDKMSAVVIAAEVKQPMCEAVHLVIVEIDVFLLLLKEQFEAGIDEHGPEDVEDPVEHGDHHRSQSYEDCTHDDGAEDPVEEHPVLILLLYGEEIENEQYDEQVVDREHLLRRVRA